MCVCLYVWYFFFFGGGGGLIFGPGIFLDFDFCPHSIIPVTWNPEYTLPSHHWEVDWN